MVSTFSPGSRDRLIEVREALQQQARAHQKDERECNLAGDQQSARTGEKTAAEPAAAEVPARLPCRTAARSRRKAESARRQAEEDAGE